MNDYYSALDEAMRRERQRSAITGRALSQEERASIISGTLAPYVSEYNRRLGVQGRLDLQQQRLNLYGREIKNQEEANKIAGYGQLAQLGLYSAPVIQGYGNDFWTHYNNYRSRKMNPWIVDEQGYITGVA